MKFHICKARVDFQIQGSQESKITLQTVIHHQSKLFISVDVVIILSSDKIFLSFIFTSSFLTQIQVAFAFIFDSLNSTKVFQSLQKGHCQTHFRLSFQQLLQTYIY
jgi:hypothetical protein